MASKVIVVAGAGPGISTGVAERFGSEGFKVALLSRTKERLDALASDFAAKGITAKGFPVDLGDATAVKEVLAQVSEDLGPITVLHWNAISRVEGGVLTLSTEDHSKNFNVSVNGLITAVQTILPDLEKQAGSAAVLVTGGGLHASNPQSDEVCEMLAASGMGIVKAAQHKAVGVLAVALKPKGIYVGEVTVLSLVKGTAFDPNNIGSLTNAEVAEKFWQHYTARSETFTEIA